MSFPSEHRNRRRRSRAEVAELVGAFAPSGLSRTAYCREHGLSLSSLKRYVQRSGDARLGALDRNQRRTPAVSLLPVEVVDRAAASEAAQATLYVELRGGHRIGVGAGFDAATLRRLIAALGEV